MSERIKLTKEGKELAGWLVLEEPLKSKIEALKKTVSPKESEQT